MSVPRLVIELPIEGRASARVVCSTFEEELRLGGDLLGRDVLGELIDTLAVLYDVLADRAAEHQGDPS